jgi:hypothetical protein
LPIDPIPAGRFWHLKAEATRLSFFGEVRTIAALLTCAFSHKTGAWGVLLLLPSSPELAKIKKKFRYRLLLFWTFHECLG